MLILPRERHLLVYSLRKRERKEICLLSMLGMFHLPPDLLSILLYSAPQITSCDLNGLSYQMDSSWVWPLENSEGIGGRESKREGGKLLCSFPRPPVLAKGWQYLSRRSQPLSGSSLGTAFSVSKSQETLLLPRLSGLELVSLRVMHYLIFLLK